MHYMDTSVLVAYYLPEAISPRVQKHYTGLSTAAISALTEVEFHSILSRRVRMKELGRDDALKVISHFRLHLAENLYRMVPIDQREYEIARDWLSMFDAPLRTFDALHLAAVFSNDLTLVTADVDLERSARSLGVKCKLIS